MADNDVKVGIGAEDTGYGAALEAAKLQAMEAAESIKGSFERVNAAFESIQTALLAFTAILAGGEAFKEMISSSVAATVASVGLGRQLGISATDASQLKVALGDTFISTETFQAANNKLSTTLKKNESAITDLGVATRDSNGNFRNSLDIQLDVNEALNKFQEGTDRNVEGIKIYGRGWMDASGTLRLTREAMEEARQKADDLGISVGERNVASTKAYRSAMNEVHDVLEGFGRAVSDQMLPILTDLGNWFAENGPAAISAFKKAMLGVTIIIDGVSTSVKLLVDFVKGAFSQLYVVCETFGEVVKDLMSGDMDAASEAVGRGYDRFLAEGDRAITEMKKDWQKGIDDVAKAFETGLDKDTAINKPREGEKSDGGDEKKAKLMAELNAELEAIKANLAAEGAAQGTFQTLTLEQQRAFWEASIARTKEGSVERLEVERNISKLTVDIAKEQYKSELEGLKASENAYKNNLDAKLALAKEFAAKVAKAEGADSAAAKTAAGQVLTIERELAAQRLAIRETAAKAREGAELAEVDSDQRQMELEVAIGVKSKAEGLKAEQEFEDRRFQIKLKALQDRLRILAMDPDTNPAKLAEINGQILTLQEQHDATMSKLQGKTVQNSLKEWRSMFQTMQSGFASTFQSFLKGSTSLGGVLKGMYASVADAVTQSLAKLAAEQVTQMAEHWAMARIYNSKEIMANAGKAASGAYSAIVGIPYVGPFLAPAAAAVAYAGAMAFDSAEGGYDIPAGVNPIVQTHQNEMILPEKYADVIRRMSGGGGGNGGAAMAGGGTNLTVNAIDARSFTKFINQNGNQISGALRRLNSRFM